MALTNSPQLNNRGQSNVAAKNPRPCSPLAAARLTSNSQHSFQDTRKNLGTRPSRIYIEQLCYQAHIQDTGRVSLSRRASGSRDQA